MHCHEFYKNCQQLVKTETTVPPYSNEILNIYSQRVLHVLKGKKWIHLLFS